LPFIRPKWFEARREPSKVEGEKNIMEGRTSSDESDDEVGEEEE
jgi:hypothetical protein